MGVVRKEYKAARDEGEGEEGVLPFYCQGARGVVGEYIL